MSTAIGCPFVDEPLGSWSKARKTLLEELNTKGGLHTLCLDDMRRLIDDVATFEQLGEYMSNTNEYYSRGMDSKWTFAEENDVHTESELYGHVTAIFNDVLKRFNVYNSDTHKVVNAYLQDPSHKRVCDQSKDIVRHCPPLRAVIFDQKYFNSTESIDSAGCTRCVTPIDVRLHNDNPTEDEDSEDLAQCGAYARQYFHQQPGRRFIYIPQITDKKVRLYRFDRCGVLRSPWIDYHYDPESLVRIILLTCAQPGDKLGANPAITWDGPCQTITVNAMKYKVKEEVFTSPSKFIRGRGSCVWRVIDKDNVERIIKYSTRPTHPNYMGESEWSLLEGFRGSKGVAEVIDHSEEESVWEHRGVTPTKRFPNSDRNASFTVMKSYGKSIKRSHSPLGLLETFRDAIAGHQNMWRKGILHRDVSEGNILQGEEDADEGYRGILIDMDRAFRLDVDDVLPEASSIIGTRSFQSLNLLRSRLPREDGQPPHPHTYLDDLQSFLWVFVWVIGSFKISPDGKSERVPSRPHIIKELASMNPLVSEAAKVQVLQDPDSINVDESYPGQFNVLKTQLVKFFAHLCLEQKKDVYPASVTLESLNVVSEYHYKKILGWVDEAIEDLKAGVVKKVEDMVFDFAADDAEIERLQDERNKGDQFESEFWTWVTNTIVHCNTAPSPPPPPPTPEAAPPHTPMTSAMYDGYDPSPFLLNTSASNSTAGTPAAAPTSSQSVWGSQVFRPMQPANQSPSASPERPNDLKRSHDADESDNNGGGKREKRDVSEL